MAYHHGADCRYLLCRWLHYGIPAFGMEDYDTMSSEQAIQQVLEQARNTSRCYLNEGVSMTTTTCLALLVRAVQQLDRVEGDKQ